MGSGKPERHSKTKEKKGLSLRNPSKKINSKKKTGINKKTDQSKNEENQNKSEASTPASASQQLSFFINEFQSANGVQLSSIELESIKETCFVELSQESGHDVMALGSHMKAAFGPSWKQVLCEGKLVEGIIDPGSPSVLIISTSALRSLELLRGVRSLTKECHAAKLFSKHMKVEEQLGNDESYNRLLKELSMLNNHLHLGNDESYNRLLKELSMLNNHLHLGNDESYNRLLKELSMLNNHLHVAMLKKRVNFASGTPSRIKKLIDIEALGLSRLTMIVLDMHADVKGYSLFTLPQVRDELWDLYKDFFHQRLLQGHLRICLFGPIPSAKGKEFKGKKEESLQNNRFHEMLYQLYLLSTQNSNFPSLQIWRERNFPPFI
ncbi:protein CMSS1 [Populus alba x Populus x berolinensis]|uniref:Protein CMSS1 n=1 Tax=Populus alba x Populus x berolinensis TaxID=444605 RepID=A0AAD6LU76_9ROSI|nr:protein CMSS1 [Populus alba x Populus x berolinensis]